jgi:hypothetical protein
MQVLPSATTPKRSVADQWTKSSCLEKCFDAANGVDPTWSAFDTWTSSCCGKHLLYRMYLLLVWFWLSVRS